MLLYKRKWRFGTSGQLESTYHKNEKREYGLMSTIENSFLPTYSNNLKCGYCSMDPLIITHEDYRRYLTVIVFNRAWETFIYKEKILYNQFILLSITNKVILLGSVTAWISSPSTRWSPLHGRDPGGPCGPQSSRWRGDRSTERLASGKPEAEITNCQFIQSQWKQKTGTP